MFKRLLILILLLFPTTSYSDSNDIKTFGRTCYRDNDFNASFCNRFKDYENIIFSPINEGINSSTIKALKKNYNVKTGGSIRPKQPKVWLRYNYNDRYMFRLEFYYIRGDNDQ